MISCIIPQYVEGIGNCTKICRDGRELILSRGVNSVLKSICEEALIDIRLARRRSSKLLGQSNLIPVFININEIYMPVRVRKPLVQRDGGYGYVNFQMIDKISDKMIILKDGSSLSFIDSKRAIMKRYKMCRILLENISSQKNSETLIKANPNTPATTEDIALLLHEITRLKHTIEQII